MFDTFRLSCLDLLVWLRSGEEAALKLNCNQATVSRHAKYIADFLELDTRKLEGEWNLGGDLSLLNAERKVHQYYRWSHGKSLRIDSNFGVGAPYFEGCSIPWVCGRSNFLNTSYPLTLLRESILDAWLGCYPDVPVDDDEFVVINLTRYPSYFLVDKMHPLLGREDELVLNDLQDYPVLSLVDGAFPKMQQHLQRLGFQPSSVRATRLKDSWWDGRTQDQLTISHGCVHILRDLAGKKVPLPLSTGLTLGDSLVVKRCFADSDNFRHLLLYLIERAHSISVSLSDVECCPDPFDWLSNSRVA